MLKLVLCRTTLSPFNNWKMDQYSQPRRYLFLVLILQRSILDLSSSECFLVDDLVVLRSHQLLRSRNCHALSVTLRGLKQALVLDLREEMRGREGREREVEEKEGI
jgi:hypothetical protein